MALTPRDRYRVHRSQSDMHLQRPCYFYDVYFGTSWPHSKTVCQTTSRAFAHLLRDLLNRHKAWARGRALLRSNVADYTHGLVSFRHSRRAATASRTTSPAKSGAFLKSHLRTVSPRRRRR